MAATPNVLIDDTEPGVMGADDARIPDDVRACFNDYDKAVVTVVPVIGVSREEWWLFDTDGTLVDVLCRHV